VLECKLHRLGVPNILENKQDVQLADERLQYMKVLLRASNFAIADDFCVGLPIAVRLKPNVLIDQHIGNNGVVKKFLGQHTQSGMRSVMEATDFHINIEY
jgi:hypothetical protein